MRTARNLFIAALLVAAVGYARGAAAQDAQDATRQAAAAPSAVAAVANIAGYDAVGARWLLDHPRALAKFLDLSASQDATFMALWNTRVQTIEPLRQARTPLCQALVADLTAGSPDDSTVGAATVALFDNHAQIQAAHKTFVTSFEAILGPAQLAAYQAVRNLAYPPGEEVTVVGFCPPPGA